MAERVSSIPINGLNDYQNEHYYENNAEMVKNWISTGGNPGSLSRNSRKDTKTTSIQSSKDHKIPSIPPRQPSTNGTKPFLKPPTIDLTPAESIIEDDITIPNDACLYGFTVDHMSTFFKHMKVNDRVIGYMHKKKIDGKKFSTLKDSELDNLGINNPIVCFFREKSKRKKAAFML
ncbi:hypothetical protein LOTGIDRAFT_232293 [Lottia gigantea]|uniref:SAM domain-containing protein n=1 Tax=Lottia gigantea TaxID=225164 RepID=V4ALI3_LOTGI|nr:hypothetical protein LOTGIDRAFT_232293 [Lottia gigantea]ESO94446.1 hypothetical protein LOTGIDRAFT_232293 [Lottia gigantea]